MRSVTSFHKPLLIALTCALPSVALAALPAAPTRMAQAPQGCAMPMHGPGPGAPGMEPVPGMPGPMPMPPALRGITLSEAQQDAVFDLMHGQMRAMREHMKTVTRIEADLRNLPFSPDYDDAKARALLETLATAQAQMRLIQLRTDREIYVLLTPEQRRQLVEGQAACATPGNTEQRPMPGSRPGMMPPPDGFRGPMDRPPMPR